MLQIRKTLSKTVIPDGRFGCRYDGFCYAAAVVYFPFVVMIDRQLLAFWDKKYFFPQAAEDFFNG